MLWNGAERNGLSEEQLAQIEQLSEIESWGQAACVEEGGWLFMFEMTMGRVRDTVPIKVFLNFGTPKTSPSIALGHLWLGSLSESLFETFDQVRLGLSWDHLG